LSTAALPVVARSVAAPFERCVFVNCPFDDDYLPLLHAMVFAIHDCGFIARLAVEDTGASEMRIDKIVRIIRESCYSIHDISRVELSSTSKLPRFNMPFEAGLAMGSIRFGHAGPLPRDFLLLDAVPFRDKQTLSDLAGQDPKTHGNDARKMVSAVRSFLSAKAEQGIKTRGADAIWARFEKFNRALPALARRLEISETEIASFDYLPDWISVMSAWLTTK
jgi:hypothetical protein